jgi:hypothetical protein
LFLITCKKITSAKKWYYTVCAAGVSGFDVVSAFAFAFSDPGADHKRADKYSSPNYEER